MGFDPVSMAFMSGAAQGGLGFISGMSKSRQAERDAQVQRQHAAYIRLNTRNTILNIRGEEARARQELINKAGIGKFVASIAGASGLSLQGSGLDALANNIDMAQSKVQELLGQSLSQQTQVQNKGNQAEWSTLVTASNLDHKADQYATGAWLSLGGNIAGGFGEAQGMDSDWGFSDIWNKWENPLSGQV